MRNERQLCIGNFLKWNFITQYFRPGYFEPCAQEFTISKKYFFTVRPIAKPELKYTGYQLFSYFETLLQINLGCYGGESGPRRWTGGNQSLHRKAETNLVTPKWQSSLKLAHESVGDFDWQKLWFCTWLDLFYDTEALKCIQCIFVIYLIY